MLANSAARLPRGHALAETYLFDQIQGRTKLHGSLTYLLYGLTDRLTVGMKPMFGAISGPAAATRVGVGDLTVLAQYSLYAPASRFAAPAIAVSFQRSIPLGRYDRLDTSPAAGLGSGTPATTAALYAQQYVRFPNGHLFRARANVSLALSGKTHVEGVSIYGTGVGFRGQARPGAQFELLLAGEYSINKNWVLALDVVHDRAGSTSVIGIEPEHPYMHSANSGWSSSFAFAPAVEYSWKSNLGVLVGTRVRLAGHNSRSSVTPAVALNFVY